MYSLLIHIVYFFIRIAAIWNEKLGYFVNGRKGLLKKIKKAVEGQDNIIWFHTASYGEFEEARPVIDALREKNPECKILLTFFSPSGYLARKNYKNADWVFYLPMDTYFNARRFVNIVKPKKAIFTIGEYWFNFLHQLKRNQVDTYVMSVRILPDSPYLKWYGFIHRYLFRTAYKNIIVKDRRSVELLNGIGVKNAVYLGDARFDRVLDIATKPWHDGVVDSWLSAQSMNVEGNGEDGLNESKLSKNVFAAGSTCPGGDDDLALAVANSHPKDKVIIIPHEIHEDDIKHIEENAKYGAVRYTTLEQNKATLDVVLKDRPQILIVDKIGILSKIYRYADISFVGGGFINMPHSVIEAAVYGMPVLMGPQYKRDIHFVAMKEAGFGFSVATSDEIISLYDKLRNNPEYLEQLSNQAYDFCAINRGSTAKILSLIFD